METPARIAVPARVISLRRPVPTAGGLLAAALVLGLVAQLLFFAQTAGINVLLWTAALLGTAALVRRPGARFDPLDVWLPAGALFFAAFVALRSDPALLAFDLLAVATLASATLPALGGHAVTRSSVVALGVAGAWVSGRLAVGAARVLAEARPWMRPLGRAGRSARALAPVVRGLLLAVPFLLLFAAAFAAADAVFARLLGDLLRIDFDFGDLPGRLVVAALGAWLAGGALLISARVGDREVPPDAAAVEASLPRPRLGSVEAVVLLLAVDLLFAAFVLVQAAYLFGGRDTLEATGLTYSAYARRGFFELLFAAGLVGALLLGVEATVAGRPRAYLTAALGLVALTAAVLASATLRLRLYQEAYGWTELRFYALAAIFWLLLALAAGAVLLILGRTRWVVHVVVVAGLVVAAGANVVGPQAFVTSQNLARALDPSLVPPDGETGLDATYLLGLADDAVPPLVAALPHLSNAERALVVGELERRREELSADQAVSGWPSWNLARERAHAALESAGETLRR